jgi:hypothetical protein
VTTPCFIPPTLDLSRYPDLTDTGTLHTLRASLDRITLRTLFGRPPLDWARLEEYAADYVTVWVPKRLPPSRPDRRVTVYVITCPHDAIDGYNLDARRHMTIRSGGQRDGDQHVMRIVDAIAEQAPVFVVSGQAPRGVVDFNRDEASAVNPDSPAALQMHRLYHASLKVIVRDLVLDGYNVVVWDFHGRKPDTPTDPRVYLGTDFGRTVFTDTDRRLAEYLRRQGLKVYSPPGEVPTDRQPYAWDYGYTTREMARLGVLLRLLHPHLPEFTIDGVLIENADEFRQDTPGSMAAAWWLGGVYGTFINLNMA